MTERQKLNRQDLVDNSIFELLNNVNPTETEIKWDIEDITKIRICASNIITEKLKLCTEEEFYPYIEEDEEDI